MPLTKAQIIPIIENALNEDIGKGDITSELTIDPDNHCTFFIRTKEKAILCGTEIARHCFKQIDNTLLLDVKLEDGTPIEAGSIIMSGSGSTRSILAAERTALNYLQHLSGISTNTKQYVDAIYGSNAIILDTRKTTPGLRLFEKYAVTVGGGQNQRLRLDDGILIKDNHIAACGSLTTAVKNVSSHRNSQLMVEIECNTMGLVMEAINLPIDRIMLDNMSVEEMRNAVTFINGRIPVEASGNITLANIKAVAETGVDFISIGALTHSARNIDLSLTLN